MKKRPDLGLIFTGTIVFWFIFTLIQLFLEKIGYPFYLFVFALITVIAIVYFSHERDKYYEDILKRIEDEIEFQNKVNHKDLHNIVKTSKYLKEKDDELLRD